MKLKIPVEDAIEILEKRKHELYEYNFDPKVWKGKTENDLREIFELGDTKWLQISGINFESFLEEKRTAIINKGKNQAEEYLNSYIEQIKRISEIQARSISANENYFEEENRRLTNELSEVLHNAGVLLEERKELIKEVEDKNIVISNLEKNSVQLDKITLNKLFGLIGNLPIGQTIGLFSTIFGIIAFAFYFGSLTKENSYLKNEYEKQKQIDELQQKVNILENQIIVLRNQKQNSVKKTNQK